MGTLANSEVPGEMPHNAAFHLGLHCFAKSKMTFREINIYFFGGEGVVITCDPSKYTMDHRDFIGLKRVSKSMTKPVK